MSASLNLSPKNPAVLALLAVGIVYAMSRKKASASTLNNNSAALNKANGMFYQSPAKAAAVQQGYSGFGGVINSVLDRVFNTANRGPVQSAEDGGNAGEAAAAAYYQANKGDFQAPNPFDVYSTDAVATNPAPGVGSIIQPNLNYNDPTDY